MDEHYVGLIPAAGGGTRLGLPYPKELTPLIRPNGFKPAAEFSVESITRSGAKEIVFVINETKHQLIGYFGSGARFGCDISYVVQERVTGRSAARSPGLADALDAGYHAVRGKTVFFAMADTILRPVDAFRVLMEKSSKDDDVVLGLFRVARPEKFGMVRYDGEGRVIAVDDKPKQTDLVHAWGCIAWRPRFTEHLRTCVRDRNMGDFAEIMNTGFREGLRGRGVVYENGHFADMGTFDEYLETQAWYQSQPE
ncbi:MAG: sugar phosphate nucleotidyltransferase [Sandaracinus sp.]